METYARELIPRLAEEGGLRLTAFINREAAADTSGPWQDVPHQVVPVHARSRVEWVRGEQQYLPGLADGAHCDIVHSLASTAPLWGRARRVTTIHDLHYRAVPDSHFGLRGLGMRVLVPAAARRSQRIVVDAASTRDDLAIHLGTPAAKVDIVPLAPSRPGPAADTAQMRQRLALGDRPVLLTVSAKRPHKNLMTLLRAHALRPAERRPVLVLPGYPTPHEHELRAEAQRLGVIDDVRFVAWVSPEELEALYALAIAFVFPSLYEGFGLPVLDAMLRGVPVACSDRGSLADVAGDAALLFDPEDPRSIAEQVGRLLDDPGLARERAAAGRDHAAGYTWRRTAQLTIGAYERALGRPARRNAA